MSSVLLDRNATQTQIDALVEAVKSIRGIHRVNVHRQTSVNTEGTGMIESEWATIYYRGTDNAVIKANGVVAILASEDQFADHDHAACVESARKMGVPAAWAHMPETYLSM